MIIGFIRLGADAARADLLTLMVVSGAQSAAILFDNGALAATPHAAVLLMTCMSAKTRHLARRVAARVAPSSMLRSGGTAGAELPRTLNDQLDSRDR